MNKANLTIFDNHVHLKNETIDFFINSYKKAGGTSLNLVNLTENCKNLDCFVEEYNRNIKISKRLKENGLDTVVTLGPYPVNIMELRKTLRFEEVFDLYENATRSAIKLINSGYAHAIGEVGRFHFHVGEKLQEEANEILRMIVSYTNDHKIPVIIHSESLDEKGMCDLYNFLSEGNDSIKLVKHFSQPLFSLRCKIIPSVPANRKNSRLAPWGKKSFFFETDFAGDLENPNFVLPPDSVPKRIRMLLQEGVELEKIQESMTFYREFYGLYE